MDNKTIDGVVDGGSVVVPVVVPVVATATVKTPRTIRTFDDIVAVVRTVTPATFATIVERHTRNHGIGDGPVRNVGRYTGMRIVDFQNRMMETNPGLDDLQLLAMFRIEHPAGSGGLFRASDPAVGVGIVRGIRASYDRNGHGAKTETWRTIKSERFGPKTFDWPKPKTAKTAV